MVFAKPEQRKQVSDLREAFEESNLPFRVDLFVWDEVPESFREQIEEKHVVILVEEEQIELAEDDWIPFRLGDVCIKIGSGATPRGGKDVYLRDGPCSLIRSQNVYNNRFSNDGLAFISEEQASKLSNVEVFPDDVLLNITGDSVARACQVATDVLPARVNQHVTIIRPDMRKLSARFLHYFLVCPDTQTMLLSWARSGGTRNALTKSMIESFDVYAPADVAEQQVIAHILGTLDDKIEFNRRMNGTLEAMARALYKSWFVDFDPVHAKAALRKHATHLPTPPGSVWSVERAREYLDRMGPAIVDLFPDGFVESELGEIPEGWEVKPFSDFFDIVGGGTPKTSISEFWGGSIPWFSVTDTPLIGNVYVVETEKYITKAGLASSSARLVPKGATIISARGTVGNLAIAGQEMAFNQSCYALRGINHVGEGYVYFSTQHMLTDLKSMAHGSVFSTITRKTFESVAWPMPSKQVLNRFEDVIAPLFSRLLIYVNGSRTLATLRDTLLPKLVSGEIRLDKENAINI